MYQATATSPSSHVSDNPSTERVSRAYSSNSLWYTLRGLFLVSVVYRSTIFAQLRFFSRNMGPRHLEVPVGNGSLLTALLRWRSKTSELPKQIVGIDCSSTMIAAAQSRFSDSESIHVSLGDVANLAFCDESFDSVNVANGFHCFPDPEAALDEIVRVLANDGTVAINALLYPRGNGLVRWPAERVNRWAQRTGLLNAPFEADDVRAMLLARNLELIEDRIHGNTLYIRARKRSQTERRHDSIGD